MFAHDLDKKSKCRFPEVRKHGQPTAVHSLNYIHNAGDSAAQNNLS